MIKGTTKTGFNYQIKDSMIDDYEIVEMLGELEDNPLIMPKLINKILGKDQVKRLKDHLRNKDGVVSTKAITEEMQDIFENETKIKK